MQFALRSEDLLHLTGDTRLKLYSNLSNANKFIYRLIHSLVQILLCKYFALYIILFDGTPK